MYNFYFYYSHEDKITCKSIKKVDIKLENDEYKHVPIDEIMVYKYSFSDTLFLFSEKETHIISCKDLKHIHIEKIN